MPTQNVNILANSFKIVDLTQYIDVIESPHDNSIRNFGIKIKSTAPINAHYRIVSSNPDGSPSPYNLVPNPETYILKGRKALGKEFLIPIQNAFFNDTLRDYSHTPRNTFTIVATEDKTNVVITPSKPIEGYPGGVPFTITLNKGQVYTAAAKFGATHMHLTGSKVVADKPIAISITDELYLFTGGDISGDQLIGQEYLGTSYVGLNSLLFKTQYVSPGLSGDQIFVMATEDNTNVDVNGSTATTINTGQMYRVNMGSMDVAYINASKPVACVQISGFMTQPGLAQMHPLSCGADVKRIDYYRYMEGHVLLNLVVPKGGESGFTLNDSTGIIDSSMFKDVPGTNGNWKYCIFNLLDTLAIKYPVHQIISVNNTKSFYQLSIMEAGLNPVEGCWGADLGFLSDFTTGIGNFQSNILGNDTTICRGDTIQLDATTPNTDSYSWNTGDTSSKIEVHNEGIYKVAVNSGLCIFHDSVQISFITLPNVDLVPDMTLCNGKKVTLTAPHASNMKYLWNTGHRGTQISVSEEGTYWVEVGTESCGYNSDTITIKYVACDCNFGLPSAFSPNGDGKNDVFKPRYSNGCLFKNYLFRIYNRWGQLVFETNNPDEGWDGKHNGKQANMDAYVYTVKFTHGQTGDVVSKKGDVTLLR